MNHLKTIRRLMWATQQLHIVRNKHRFGWIPTGNVGGSELPPPPAPGGTPAYKFNQASNSMYLGLAML